MGLGGAAGPGHGPDIENGVGLRLYIATVVRHACPDTRRSPSLGTNYVRIVNIAEPTPAA